MAKFCTYCGKKIDENDNVCGYCGNAINKNNTEVINIVNNTNKTDGFATAGFVLSLVSFFLLWIYICNRINFFYCWTC